MRSLLLPALVVPVLVLSAGPVSAAPVETWTDVQHNVVFTDTFPDDVFVDREPRWALQEGQWTQVALSLRFDDSKRHPDIECLMIEQVYTRTG